MKRIAIWIVLIAFIAFNFSIAKAIETKDVKGSAAATIAPATGNPTATATASIPAPTFTAQPGSLQATPTSLPTVLAPGSLTQKIAAFIRAPSGTVNKPYVILSAYGSLSVDPGNITIRGTLQNQNFVCQTPPCSLEVPTSGQIRFSAFDINGSVSDEIQANIQVTALAFGGYTVSITSLGRFVYFSDACANIWGNAERVPPSWASFPQDPSGLNTDKNLYYLAGRLITNGIVDAKDCPGGGVDFNSPNACGLTKSKDQMVAWQNQFDFNIWQTGKDESIPPFVLKTLIEVESQFWPSTQRVFVDEIGLGQINQLGIDVLLRTNPDIYNRICLSALYKCDQPYVALSPIERALIRGAYVQSLDASCATCKNGIDLSKAAQSISTIGKVLYSNCVQTKSLLSMNGVRANYQDSWKFTLVSYHSGFGCLQSALTKSVTALPLGSYVDWNNVSSNLACAGSAAYVDKFWESLTSLSINLKPPEVLADVQIQAPVPTVMQPTPTEFVSSARAVVKLFVDKNQDGIIQPDEALDNVLVVLELQNGTTMNQVSKNGMAIFDLTGIPIGTTGKITLTGFYRSAAIQVPASGDLPITFIFSNPVLPTQFP